MSLESNRSSRRDFVSSAGRLASAAVLTGCATATPVPMAAQSPAQAASASDTWDLSWVDRLAGTTERAVFDAPTIADGLVLDLAGRYLDNCDAVYGKGRHTARVVLNIRTQAVPMALTDAAWERLALGTEYNVKDPATQQPATRNPFWRRAPGTPGPVPPTLEEMVGRGAIVLVCDFALGHLATRLAARTSREAAAVHRELRGSFVPGAIAVPSGIFGLAKAQNAGCAYVRA